MLSKHSLFLLAATVPKLAGPLKNFIPLLNVVEGEQQLGRSSNGEKITQKRVIG